MLSAKAWRVFVRWHRTSVRHHVVPERALFSLAFLSLDLVGFGIRGLDPLAGMVTAQFGVFVIDVDRDHAPAVAALVANGFENVPSLGASGCECTRKP
jgi:hypothetical protein